VEGLAREMAETTGEKTAETTGKTTTVETSGMRKKRKERIGGNLKCPTSVVWETCVEV